MPVTFRIDKELVDALDAEADRLSRELQINITRVEVLRRWLRQMAERVGEERRREEERRRK